MFTKKVHCRAVNQNEECKHSGVKKHYHCSLCNFATDKRDRLTGHSRRMHVREQALEQKKQESRLKDMETKSLTRLKQRHNVTQYVFLSSDILTTCDISSISSIPQ